MSIPHDRKGAEVGNTAEGRKSNLIATLFVIMIIMGLVIWGSCAIFGMKITFSVLALATIIGVVIMYFSTKNAPMDPNDTPDQDTHA